MSVFWYRRAREFRGQHINLYSLHVYQIKPEIRSEFEHQLKNY